MDITAYRNRGRTPIVLPSGLEGFVRAPTVMDIAAYPALLRAPVNGDGGEGGDRETPLEDWVHCILRRCFIPARGVMCDKEPGLCGPGELSIHELDSEDATAIMNAVQELSTQSAGAPGTEGEGSGARGNGRAPESNPSSFPAGAAGPPGDDPLSGEDLRPPSPPSGPE